jgi:hypothetical protein
MKVGTRWLLMSAIGTAVVLLTWMWRFSGPSLTPYAGETGPELANIHLGEYYLNLDELRIIDLSTGNVIVEASAARDRELRKTPYSVPIQVTSDLRPALRALDWVPHGHESAPVPLHAGGRYRIEVRGNNGFGYSNWTDRVIVAGQS